MRSLEKKGFVEAEDVAAERDPLRASAARLRVEFVRRPEQEKLPKAERELLAYLELHPGSHNLAELEDFGREGQHGGAGAGPPELVRLTLEAGGSSQRARSRAARAESASAGGVRRRSARALEAATISDISARRRHRIGQDRSVSERRSTPRWRWAAAR